MRLFIPKGRHEGCSTYAEGRFYWRVTHKTGVRAFVLAHEQEATDNPFAFAQCLLQAVSNAPGTEVILVSTGNGLGNFFRQNCQDAERGETNFEALFIPWFWVAEYRAPLWLRQVTAIT